MKAKLRILLADDHALLREGLALLINAQPDMEVVAEAGDGRVAVQLAKASEPDIAVLDVSMPHMDGSQAAEQIRDLCPNVRVLALTRHSNQGYLHRMLAAGARGYVLKNNAAERLISAIRVVAEGGSYVEPTLGGGAIARGFQRQPQTDREQQPRVALSDREEEVLRAVAWGRSSKDIANELAISVKTVESYKASAAEKLQLRGRTEILRYALASGWLNDEAAPE